MAHEHPKFKMLVSYTITITYILWLLWYMKPIPKFNTLYIITCSIRIIMSIQLYSMFKWQCWTVCNSTGQESPGFPHQNFHLQLRSPARPAAHRHPSGWNARIQSRGWYGWYWWISMDIYGYWWILMDIDARGWIRKSRFFFLQIDPCRLENQHSDPKGSGTRINKLLVHVWNPRGLSINKLLIHVNQQIVTIWLFNIAMENPL